MSTGNSLQERYAGTLSTPSPPCNDTLETIIGGRSRRNYPPRDISRQTLDLLIAAAQSAPSSCNMQSWSVVAAIDRGAKARIRAITGNQAPVEEAPPPLIFLADPARLQQVATDNGTTHEALDYPETLPVALIDASLAAQNPVTAAGWPGLGGRHIGSISTDIPEMSRLPQLPETPRPANLAEAGQVTIGIPAIRRRHVPVC